MSLPKTAYSVTAAYYHWLVAIPAVGCVGSVLKAQQRGGASPKIRGIAVCFSHMQPISPSAVLASYCQSTSLAFL